MTQFDLLLIKNSWVIMTNQFIGGYKMIIINDGSLNL